MKVYKQILAGLLMLGAQELTAQKTPKAIMVIVDGIPADLLERTSTPNIDQISTAGGYSRGYVGGEKGGYSQTPTVSAVSYNSMLTGTWVHKHNVWNNSITAPNYHYPTIFRLLRKTYPEKKLALYSTWSDNRTRLLGENLPETGYLKLDFAFDGYELDKDRFPHDERSDHINRIDEEVIRQACLSLRKEAPDLSWVYLQYTDDVGHALGDSDKMQEAIRKMDRQMGELYGVLTYREQYFDEDWMIIIVTDHGRDVATGQNHGGQSARERTIWMATNKKPLNKYFYAYTPAIVDVFPTVARHLEIAIPREVAYELDGIPLIGDLSIAEPHARIAEDHLRLEWTPFEPRGKVTIRVALTNRFETSGEGDKYLDLGTFEAARGRAEIPLTAELREAPMLKIVIEGEKNVLNRWIVR